MPTIPTRWRLVSRGCLVLLLSGAALQATVRDWIPFPVSAVYYALPRPVLLGLALLAWLTGGRERRLRLTGVMAIIVAWVAWKDIAWHAPLPAEASSRVAVYWNVGHNLEDDASVIDGFLVTRPAILALGETGPLDDEWLTAWADRHPQYDYAVPHQGLFLAVRGRILEQGYHALGFNSHAGWVDAEIDRQLVRVVLVDIAANPWINRQGPLMQLTGLLAGESTLPVLVMGDFNTPPESVWLDGMQRDYREAFQTAGRGYMPTWPWPVPVLKLDQVWANRKVAMQRAWQTSTRHSDHCPQWLEFTLLPAGTAD